MSEPQSTPPLAAPRQYVTLTPVELAARKRRNVFIALGLVAFMMLLFTTTFLRMMHNQSEARAQMAPVGSIDR
ncbi:hypothetical protein [Brevundimonas sp.]|jgi:hypothetical protein|uniref:hypothetical protein n=1 Tax=Brevundimonas sp. TaxID=1871086 RepID=UPI0037846E28